MRRPGATTGLRGLAGALLQPRTLDRYMVAQLIGPFLFGLSAFTLIFAAVNVLAISKLVGEQHAPIPIAIAYFLWQLPQIVITVLPVAILLGTLLALLRLSSDSELTAMKAGGISLVRAVTPMLVVGFVVSLAALVIQESVVPYANDRSAYLRDQAIRRVGGFGNGSHTVVTPLPDGGRQLTYFKGFDPRTQALVDVTILTYDRTGRVTGLLESSRGRYVPPRWSFEDARELHVGADGVTQSYEPLVSIDVGEKPSELQLRALDNNRETMSRAQLRTVMASNQLSGDEIRQYQTTYDGKLARPFASFIFTLIAIPFGLRPARGGGGMGAGFGLALVIAFVYFVVTSVSLAVAGGTALGGRATPLIGAWLPNVVFIAIGAMLLRRAART